ncbi:MAG: hypothetical protein A2622_02730 [Bdellovibrionales bacterium RIFCSPHIGHO2_01_FULL_40_29]|nr:MAG: hypothetical protein A2622_02730 [Bdellovibrionales bacterium RIFCSPHIGHO2_01_FULL_40_29]OFZ33994.1 MAG: hypothetical protein A3D17_03150 [Bdellovibrionales bacterium RIFCSPHIGHO2_02_FULL_40_15]
MLIEAKDAINALNYSGAITILTTQVSASSQAKLEFKEALASAYAGQCGLNFASFVNGLASATSGSAFRLVMNPFVGVVVDSPSCLQSLNLMETIGTTESRTTNQNAFVSVVGMVLMGSQTRVSSDVTPTNGDGTIDADVCAMSNDDIDRVILGFGFMSKNFSALSTAQLGSTSQTSITDSITQCSAVAGSTCEIIDPAEITDPLRDVMRDLLNTIEYGVGSVVTNGDPLLIPGACP